MLPLQKLMPVSSWISRAYKATLLAPTRSYSKHDDGRSKVLTKISAAAQLASQSVESETTMLEAPEPVQRMVELENIRSKINELDQRKIRHKEYAKMIKQLIVKPQTYAPELKLPFKQPNFGLSQCQSLRKCSNVEEVLQLTKCPQQLANELVKLAEELASEKRRNELVISNYWELKQQVHLDGAKDAKH
ncbi:uncharacterized protein LOC108606602 [Drosophila busckii]|uniref:uncharacterized protein LOC108606602 n=1 Tax=Drosophila busckii TaxID=30019 RepID=UPI00083F254D|nr:uncharacterized protein LOC108606602 [Drosophila busckii]